MTVTIDDIRAASERIEGAVSRTPSTHSRTLSSIANADIYLKFEIFQFTASFKERGALNKLLNLSEAQREQGVVAVSAGNHAQAVAYHAARLNIPATIFMPEGSPFTKVQNTQRLGAEVMLVGDSLSAAAKAAYDLCDKNGMNFVHPYDDEAVIAGQGTVGLEFVEDFPNLDDLIVPIGGGGLISGVAIAAKSINSKIRIIGVQSELYPAMKNVLAGEPFTNGGHSVAEGIAVKEPGDITREIVCEKVDEIRIVSERAIEDAINTYLEVEKVLVEGAGAAGLGALLEHQEDFAGRKVGLILTGGNIDLRLLASGIMRGLTRDGRISRLRILIPDIPGSLAKVSAIVADKHANVMEVEHQREFADIGLKQAELNLVIETQDRRHTEEIVSALEGAGFEVSKGGAVIRG